MGIVDREEGRAEVGVNFSVKGGGDKETWNIKKDSTPHLAFSLSFPIC